MNTTDLLANDLSNFIEDLRFASYNIGMTQFIAAQNLILALIERDALPTEPEQLRILLGPVLCHSAQEQAEFKQYFDEWMSRFEKSIAAVETSRQDSVSPKKTPSLPPHPLWKWFIIAFVTVLTGISIYYEAYQTTTNSNRMIAVMKFFSTNALKTVKI